MAKTPNWAQEELDILRKYYPQFGRSKEIQDLLPSRSIEGICLKANRIGLKVLNNIRECKTNKWYISQVPELLFMPLEEYKGSTIPILHLCMTCGNEWKVRPQGILKAIKEGTCGCPVCDLSSRVHSDKHVDEILATSNITRLSKYTGSLDNITLKHDSCGYIWDTKFSYIQQGSGCPICNKGFGYFYSNGHFPDTATLYLLKITLLDEEFLKIGITARKTDTRIRELKSDIGLALVQDIKIIKEVQNCGLNILKLEKQVLNSKSQHYVSKYKFGGYTELYNLNDEELIKNIMENNGNII